MRASVSGLMALLVLWFFSIKYIHSFNRAPSKFDDQGGKTLGFKNFKGKQAAKR